ncbi:MAG: Ppx/GppA phosphatase family protein [Thermodesulfobacteriota bacterium]|nr:Ppx/GppA phosphatase family protein [Thermodesulfobacteriota bacterium]
MKSAPTSPERVASIDIGTNTILLLIAEVRRGKLKTLFDTETIVRLGEGVQKNGMLSEGAMQRGFQTLEQYLKQCQEMEVQKTFAIGTSALREAKNSAIFLQRVKEEFDLSIDVISGEEEARLSFLSVVRDLKKSRENLLVVDVGGGSTELILGKGDEIIRWVSLPLGIVRFTERFLISDPVKEDEYRTMVEEIRKQLPNFPILKNPISMVSIGGTGAALASVEQGLEKFMIERIHRFVLTREALRNQLSLYCSKTIEERKEMRGLPPSRADVILAGGTILYLIMEKFDCSSLMVNGHGVRYGLLYKQIADLGLRLPAG